MVALVGTLIALIGIAVFCGAGVLHFRWEMSQRAGVRREHRCARCGYSLKGIEGEVCPECGRDRSVMEPLTERRRAVISLWMCPAVLACMFGLMTSEPRDILGPTLLACAWLWFASVACRQISMTPYFAILAVGLSVVALMALGEKVGETPIALLMGVALVPMFLGPVGLMVTHFRRGRLLADRPVKHD